MHMLKITSRSAELEKVQTLYCQAFPENERSPFHLLLDDPTNCSEVFAFFEGTVFCGFLSLLTLGGLSHIIYFATDEPLRGKGFGAEALGLLRKMKPRHRLLADIEVPAITAENNAQREKRKAFYLRNGYHVSGVSYTWREEAYEILVSGGPLTEKEFWDFWKEADRVNPAFSKF